MQVGVLELAVYLPETMSLKEKRAQVKSLLGKVQARFKVSVAEVGDNDLWQKARIGFAIVGNDPKLLATILNKIEDFVSDEAGANIVEIFKSVEVTDGQPENSEPFDEDEFREAFLKEK